MRSVPRGSRCFSGAAASPSHLPVTRWPRAVSSFLFGEAVAAVYGAEGTVDLIRGHPVTANDAAFAGFVFDITREFLCPAAVHAMSHPIMASEDLSYVLECVPGAIANLNTCPESGPAFPDHPTRMLVNKSALATGMAMHVAGAQRFLERGR